jgi:pimeloyl-ACP methyl ester carboxylesterase
MSRAGMKGYRDEPTDSTPMISLEVAEPATDRHDWYPPQGQLQVPLAVRALGQGPPTVLLHGLLGSNRYWGGAFDRLADNGLLLTPDLLGFGASPRPVSGYGPEEHGKALINSLRTLNVSGKVLLVGHSLGAMLAIWMAGRYPDLVRGVVAFAPPIYRDPQHARKQIAQLGWRERLFGSGENWAANVACQNLCQARPALAVRLYSMIRPDLPYPLVEDSIQHSWASYSETLRRLILAAEGANWLASAGSPVLLVVGTADKYLDLEFLRSLADQHPHVHLDVWAGQGHDLPLSQPERCLSAIESWGDPALSGGDETL